LWLRLGEELGKGQFGKVLKGVWSKPVSSRESSDENNNDDNEVKSEEKLEVAVKMLKDNSTVGTSVKFLREAVIMGQFNNANVVELFGVVTDGEPVRLTNDLGLAAIFMLFCFPFGS